MKKLAITVRIDPDGREVTAVGRDAWALRNLIRAGERGCTPIDTPGPRWSHYVFKLRAMGIIIETIHEPHDGPFAGTHARYVLRSKLSTVDDMRAVA